MLDVSAIEEINAAREKDKLTATLNPDGFTVTVVMPNPIGEGAPISA